ncbi:hypothetical protein [Thalassomonas actiniarum]|uniref:Uncharacterized protein n=1 Tax=Thalassomonas actiniarum TaxID=485447 RepID=A0AAE9YQV2_9GAMM|nr:hypothetical protein [Thalassomonas actiniarum]WDD97892.1 hypothetical protein SG35_021760 [Thalassomonas actiniarum]
MGFFNFFQGKKLSKQGEVEVLGKALMKNRVDIHKLLLDDGSSGVGLNIVTKGVLSYSSMPLSLNENQARELITQIKEALGDK